MDLKDVKYMHLAMAMSFSHLVSHAFCMRIMYSTKSQFNLYPCAMCKTDQMHLCETSHENTL